MASRTEDLHSLLSRIPYPAIRSLFTPEFILCSEEFDRFTVDTLLNLVSELGLPESLSRGTTVGETGSRNDLLIFKNLIFSLFCNVIS